MHLLRARQRACIALPSALTAATAYFPSDIINYKPRSIARFPASQSAHPLCDGGCRSGPHEWVQDDLAGEIANRAECVESYQARRQLFGEGRGMIAAAFHIRRIRVGLWPRSRGRPASPLVSGGYKGRCLQERRSLGTELANPMPGNPIQVLATPQRTSRSRPHSRWANRSEPSTRVARGGWPVNSRRP
jgi:hypothetical protein